jgi:hypothetical protein
MKGIELFRYTTYFLSLWALIALILFIWKPNSIRVNYGYGNYSSNKIQVSNFIILSFVVAFLLGVIQISAPVPSK